MRQFILITLVSMALSACEGDLDDNTTWSPGIYNGNFTPTGAAPEPSIVMITSDNKALYAETDVESVGLGTVSGDTLNLGPIASATLTGQLSGTYNFAGITGSFNLTNNEISSRGSSLSTVEGIWIDNTFTSVSGISTWTITNGVITLSTVEGCNGTGTIAPIDSAYNEYTVFVTITGCPDIIYNGVYTGLAATDDSISTNDTIFMLLGHSTAGLFIFGYPLKQ